MLEGDEQLPHEQLQQAYIQFNITNYYIDPIVSFH